MEKIHRPAEDARQIKAVGLHRRVPYLGNKKQEGNFLHNLKHRNKGKGGQNAWDETKNRRTVHRVTSGTGGFARAFSYGGDQDERKMSQDQNT